MAYSLDNARDQKNESKAVSKVQTQVKEPKVQSKPRPEMKKLDTTKKADATKKPDTTKKPDKTKKQDTTKKQNTPPEDLERIFRRSSADCKRTSKPMRRSSALRPNRKPNLVLRPDLLGGARKPTLSKMSGLPRVPDPERFLLLVVPQNRGPSTFELRAT